MERMAWERFMQMERRRLKERREGKLRRALRDKRASHMRRGRKEATSYVPPPDPVKSEGMGRVAHRGEGWQDRTRVGLLGSALALGPVGHHRPTRTLLVS